MVKKAPKKEKMTDPMGHKGWGGHIAKNMKDKRSFKIQDFVPRDGCCYDEQGCCAMCAPGLKGRSYLVFGENYYEKNDPCALCLCCCIEDDITKSYYDRGLFTQTCCEQNCSCCCFGDGRDNFVTEHDWSYCCCVLPCHPCYDSCCRPCYAGCLGRSLISRSSPLSYNLATRCCGPLCVFPMAAHLKDSKKAKELLLKRLKTFEKKNDDYTAAPVSQDSD